MTIGIVGLGYVGLPLAVAFAEAGQRVVGVDTNVGRVNQLRAGESYIEDIPTERLQAVASRIEATTRAQRLALCDAVIIAVPTPSGEGQFPMSQPGQVMTNATVKQIMTDATVKQVGSAGGVPLIKFTFHGAGAPGSANCTGHSS